MVEELWVERYRPKTTDDYVFQDKRLRTQVESWIKDKTFPHLLLSGPAGTGKSSLARILINEIGINPGDVLYMNASDSTSIDDVRGKILPFASSVSFGDFKVILLEESDYASPNAQGGLRRVMEDFAHVTRFILTCNLIHKVIPAIKSRCQEIVLQSLDSDMFKLKMVEILSAEGVAIEDESVLDTYIKATYPDLRKCINTMQLNSQDGQLLLPDSNQSSSSDWQIQAIELFKKGQIRKARELLVSQIRPDEIDDFFRLCYKNLNWWGTTSDQQEEAILIIRDGMVKNTMCADQEINLSATLTQLARISK